MSLDSAIKHMDAVQAELTIHPEGCPEPWRTWMIEAHRAMCEVIRFYKEQGTIIKAIVHEQEKLGVTQDQLSQDVEAELRKTQQELAREKRCL